MKFLTLILPLALFAGMNTAEAAPITFGVLSQQYAQANLPSANDLLNHAWGFAAVVGNPNLKLNQGASDRVDLANGIKNADGSQMYLRFRNDAPTSMYPFLSMDRHNNFSGDTSTFFNRVDQDQANKNITYLFDMGTNDGTYYTNQCRLTTDGNLLLCQVIYNITTQAMNPIYRQPKYQEANGKVVVIQVFKRDLE